MKRALLSVSDKTGLEGFANELSKLGFELLATGGTADRLREAGIAYRAIETFTGNPEAFDGRMKTISFKLESAILFDRTNPRHVNQARELGVEPIDLVVCNFYPFEETLAKGGTEQELVDQVDIGGPTMVRAAAKNFKSVTVLTDPADYPVALSELRARGEIAEPTRRRWMLKAFEAVLRYDQAIFEGFSRRPLRYGENPHQRAYFVPDAVPGAMTWELVEPAGLELSYNNILDAQAALGAVRDVWTLLQGGAHARYSSVAIVKHNNPCGLAVAPNLETAFAKAWEGDPVSAFGGVLALSSPLTVDCARMLDEKFVEVLVAPGFESGSLEELRRKKKKLRILKVNGFGPSARNELSRVRVDGGTLVQNFDEDVLAEGFTQVTRSRFSPELEPVARFGVVAAKWIKSNAIALARALPGGGYQLVGMGSGQPNRVDAVRRLAVPKAREVAGDLGECVLVSDAFFPFPDNIEEAHAAGVRFVVQPGGSIRDGEVIAACDRLGVAMAFTGRRHFRH